MSRTRTSQSFQTVRSEGGLLPMDILQRIAAQDKELPGLTQEAYHLAPGMRFGEAISSAWIRIVAAWHSFQDALNRLPQGDPATTITRERFLLPLFEELKYGRLPKKASSFEVDGRSYAISHEYHRSPIHMLGCRVSLEDRVAGLAGAAKSSPHGLVQDLLNRSEQHLWGFVTNGLVLRLLRDHHSLTQQAYVEFDLQAMLDGQHYSDFVLLWLLCHQSRVEAERPDGCWLERWMEAARDEGIRALDRLRAGVEQAIAALGTGFLKHPRNVALKDDLHTGNLDKQEYYRQLLRLVYRLIFLFVAEDRGALLDPKASEAACRRYERFYSTRKLRTLSDRRRGGPHGDLWQGLRLVMDKLYEGCPELGLPALGSFLWSPQAIPDLRHADCANEHLLAATRALCFFTLGVLRFPVNWRQIGADELGSIYESLLELHPRLNKEAGTFELDTAAGHERKTTGSYYTPASLVDCLLDSALDPVVDAAVAKKGREEAERALLSLKVCDPACGSGHFLVAAARRIAKRLAAIRTGDDEPSPTALQHALRDVVGHCIFGVDQNAMAVELCKVSLWMEAIEPGRPLSFLEHHIQHGNSLLGTTPTLLEKGIPDDAWIPIEGDDRETAKRLKKRNRDFRKTGQTMLDSMLVRASIHQAQLTAGAIAIEDDPDDALPDLRKKESDWQRFTSSRAYQDAQFLCDLWCAAFVWPKQSGELEACAPTEEIWFRATQNLQSIPASTRSEVRKIAQQYHFFHWHLAFPQVFRKAETEIKANSMGGHGGFDVVLGNPPWDHIELKEEEFFASRRPDIAKAQTAALRKRAIARLAIDAPELTSEFRRAQRQVATENQLVRNTGRFPLCARGRINTYALFAELNRELIHGQGRVGNILPSGIAMDETTKEFFSCIVKSNQLVSLFHFENEEFIFPTVHHAYRFCLLTLSGRECHVAHPTFVAYARRIEHVNEMERQYSLTANELASLNPNTCTFSAFRTRRDAQITKAVYQKIPIFIAEAEGQPCSSSRHWNVNFRAGLFNMASSSDMFVPKEELERQGFQRHGNLFWRNQECMIPLYEAKMIHHFDHRFGTYEGQTEAQRNQGKLPEFSVEQHQDPYSFALPDYWVPSHAVAERLAPDWQRGWLICWRKITGSEKSRTVVSSVIPRVGVGDSGLLALPAEDACLAGALHANLASFCLDFIARQKVGGVNLTFNYMTQMAVIAPDDYRASCIWSPQQPLIEWLLPRILELTYTAWDLEPFAKDCGYDGPPFRWEEPRRFLLRCELDATFFHLYGIARDDVNYIMETFPIVKRRDIAAHGSYRTQEQILDIYDLMQRAIDTGEPYQTLLDPPPADPRVAHPPREPTTDTTNRGP